MGGFIHSLVNKYLIFCSLGKGNKIDTALNGLQTYGASSLQRSIVVSVFLNSFRYIRC